MIPHKINQLVINVFRSMFVLALVSCGGADCDMASRNNIMPRQGYIQIDTIYLKMGDRGHTVKNNRTGATLLYNVGNFLIKPKVGDSLVKDSGKLEYTLYTKDSIYV